VHRDFAFIQTAPNRVFIGWGPFEQLPFRRPDRPAFYIADFFLDDPHPWRHPATWEEMTFDELSERFGLAFAPRIEWDPMPIDAFRPLFDAAKAAMQRGDFTKIVPVQFENGQLLERVDLWPWFFRRLASVPAGMAAYGYSYQNHGLAGATPEILFQSDARGYRTIALAGTRPADRAAELLRDSKELREHRMVVEDIVRRLAPFGNVEVEPMSILELPGIAHLATPIRFEEIGIERMSFTEMVRRLHPTAALGVWPRTEAGERWLREADRGVKRRTFGAPIGLELPNHRALALVAIRNVQWHGDSLRVGSGAGLLPESHLDREFDELREKREQVKALLGLADVGRALSSSGPAESRSYVVR
jgi:menaquinone-specific isochorismate synthase